MSLTLPDPIEAYFAAANTDDADRVAASFTETAIIHDEGQEILGRAAIRAWATEARRKYSFQSEALSVEDHAELHIVTAHVVGDFPGSPVDLRYRFRLEAGKVDALEIG